MKQITAWATLAFMIFFTLSCTGSRLRVLPIQSVKESTLRKPRIHELVTKDGKWIKFSLLHRGKVVDGKVTGLIRKAGRLQKVSVDRSMVRLVQIRKNSFSTGLVDFFTAFGVISILVISVGTIALAILMGRPE